MKKCVKWKRRQMMVKTASYPEDNDQRIEKKDEMTEKEKEATYWDWKLHCMMQGDCDDN
jgi:hypothetical protein